MAQLQRTSDGHVAAVKSRDVVYELSAVLVGDAVGCSGRDQAGDLLSDPWWVTVSPRRAQSASVDCRLMELRPTSHSSL